MDYRLQKHILSLRDADLAFRARADSSSVVAMCSPKQSEYKRLMLRFAALTSAWHVPGGQTLTLEPPNSGPLANHTDQPGLFLKREQNFLFFF